MRNYACYGYTLPAIDLAIFLSGDKVDEWKEMLAKGCDVEECWDFYRKNTPDDAPMPESFFLIDSEMESEDLEEGELYAFFNEDDLYVRKPTLMLRRLQDNGQDPKPSRWVTWG